jgi:hypothetical protein
MKLEVILNVLILILGILVAIAPYTFAPVCMMEQCQFTRLVETVFGSAIAVLGFIGMYRGLQ